MTAPDLHALIFDFDGLILDTESPVLESWQTVYREHGLELPVAEWVKCIGTHYGPDTFDPVAYLEAHAPAPVNWQVTHYRRHEYEMAIADKLPPLPGVTRLIEEAQEAGLPLAIASSSLHAWVDGHLQRLGLWEAFAAVICADDVNAVKPAPDLFLAAAAALDVPPAGAVVFEDSVHGVTAAKAAGMFCVAVPNPLMRDRDYSAADLRADSLAALTLADVRAAFVNGRTV